MEDREIFNADIKESRRNFGKHKGAEMKIEVEVSCCKECPYYYIEQDMGASLPMCKKINHVIIDDTNSIFKDCPLVKDEQKIPYFKLQLQTFKSNWFKMFKPYEYEYKKFVIDLDKLIKSVRADERAKVFDEFKARLEKHQQDNWVDNLEYGITFEDIDEVIEEMKSHK